MFLLAPMEGVRPIEAEQRRDLGVGRFAQDMRAPAERGGGLRGGADRMAGVELAIAKGALAIFPASRQGIGTQPEQKAALGQNERRFNIARRSSSA